MDYSPHHIFLFVQLTVNESVVVRHDKISPNKRGAGNFGRLAGWNFGKVDDFKPFFQVFFTFLSGSDVVIKNVKCVQIFILRIDSIAGKAAA